MNTENHTEKFLLLFKYANTRLVDLIYLLAANHTEIGLNYV